MFTSFIFVLALLAPMLVFVLGSLGILFAMWLIGQAIVVFLSGFVRTAFANL